MLLKTALAVTLAFAATAATAAPETYSIDPGHTQVLFSWNHFGFSHPTGNFDDISGSIVYDADDLSKSTVEVTIVTSSINTHVPALDEHLQKDDFFDAAKYPKITFKSTAVEPGATKSTFKVTGNLDLHGVSKPVVLMATLNKAGEHPMSKTPTIGFDATATLSRSAFGIAKYVPNIADEVTLRITTEAVGKRPEKAE